MINKPYLVRLDDEIIINLQNVTTIARNEDKLFICFVGLPEDPLILKGDTAKAIWIYFSSAMMSFHPLKIKNPEQEALDIPNSIGK
ncbi:MAG: hypothetical protein V7L21_29570 [Nostoc sp.]|uniref:hypothetical protein n=1 Tax=Nostoc sp. TaxID=1180 RepID=UPI002FFC348D